MTPLPLLRLALAVAAATSLALAACGDDDRVATVPDDGASATTGKGDGSSGDSGGSGEPTMEMTFDVSGSVTVEGTTTRDLPVTDGVPFPANCAEYVDSGGSDVLPLPFLFGEDVAGHTIGFTLLLEGYTGPDTYTDDQIDTDGGQYLRIDGDGYGQEDGGPSPTVTVNADGSGELALEDLSNATTPEKTISGRVRWTCED